MLFSSNIFLFLFLPIVIIVNWLIKPKYSNIFLLLASLLFYAWGEPIYVLLMLFSVVINWGFGLLISKYQARKRILLIACVAINLLILGYFKYFNFFIDVINSCFNKQLLSFREIALPIGISFFTFQALSYVIDLCRGNCQVQRNVLNLALYISFFPQLIAGPIVRYSDIDKQINNRIVTYENFGIGFRRFLYGLGKKVIISNAMAQLTDSIFELPFDSLTTVTAWLGALAYTMQIYYDFSGYSDMAIGLGKIFGFDFLENFNYPYLSCSIHEFWQRWHISLGTWFREYVYIPLGGNRKGKLRTYLNLIAVFFLTGMWHGASWNFIVWGLYHGFFQIIERLKLKFFLEKHKFLSRIYCVLVVIFGWVMFRSESLINSIRYILRMIVPFRYGFSDMFTLSVDLTTKDILIFVFAFIGCGVLQLLFKKIPTLTEKWKFSKAEAIYLALVLIYSIILLAAGTYNPFIYFRF
jgi:alginate O-acetyltransferase complex protein AlgI